MRPIQQHFKENWHIPESLEKLIPIPTRFCNNLPLFMSPVPDEEGHGHVCLPPDSPDSKCHEQDPQPRLLTDNSHSPRLAQHVVVLGSGKNVNSESSVPNNVLTQPFNRSLHRDLPSLNLHAWHLEPLPSSLVKW